MRSKDALGRWWRLLVCFSGSFQWDVTKEERKNKGAYVREVEEWKGEQPRQARVSTNVERRETAKNGRRVEGRKEMTKRPK